MKTIVVLLLSLFTLSGCAAEAITKDQAEALTVEERAPEDVLASPLPAPAKLRADVQPASATCHQGTVRDDGICLLGYGSAGETQQLSTWWCPVDEAAGPYGNGNYGSMPQWQGSCRHFQNNGSTDSIWCCN